jgi:pimeloyl-ACP methyl ester carboxylesterase
MFTRFARAATRRGFNVIRFDFRGHGRSAGTDRDFLISGQRLDLAAVLAHARGLDLDPRYLIGMSFGASPVVSELAGPTSYPGLVLWSPAVDYARTCLQPNTPWAREILASRDHATLPDWAFARIPGSGFLISKELAAEAEADRTAAVLRATRAPVLAFSAIDDEKAPYEPLAEVAAANASIDVRRIPGEHSLAEGRPRVIWETLDWIEDRASSRG